MKAPSLILLILLLITLNASAQSQCATVEYNLQRHHRHAQLYNKREFESWIKNIKKTYNSNARTQAKSYTFPVVFHIIHQGEPEGQGSNIPSKRIYEQIKTLNEDFQRKNEDAINTPSSFLPVAGSMNVEFVLARQDPDGLPTEGIVRVNGNRRKWSYSDDRQLKALSYWDAERYINIWVTALQSTQGAGLGGYAQFPTSDQLNGLESFSADAETDGVVVRFDVVGSESNNRVLTHEMGHFFGLRHIWGDDSGCDQPGDYVEDTPTQSSPTEFDCPTHPIADCNGYRMFQNYMDYTVGECQNMFSREQINRMLIVVENSPRRKSLNASVGLERPVIVENNVGIKKMVDMAHIVCTPKLTPRIKIYNYGNNEVSSTSIQIQVNSQIVQVKDFTFRPALSSFEPLILSFDDVDLPMGRESEVTFTVLQTNKREDNIKNNNTLSGSFTLPDRIEAPFYETFEEGIGKWIVDNPDQQITWDIIDTENNGFAGKSMYINFYNYPNNESSDRLISPIIEFPAYRNEDMTLTFSWLYSPTLSNQKDILRVVLTENCNTDLSQGIEIFNRSDKELTTVSKAKEDPFIPSGIQEWKTYFAPLSKSITRLKNVQIVFEGTSGQGQNLYVDDIYISPTPPTRSLYRAYIDYADKTMKVAFNLPSRKMVNLQLYKLSGKRIAEDTLPSVLNETYSFPIAEEKAGIYILRIQFDDQVETIRLFLNS